MVSVPVDGERADLYCPREWRYGTGIRSTREPDGGSDPIASACARNLDGVQADHGQADLMKLPLHIACLLVLLSGVSHAADLTGAWNATTRMPDGSRHDSVLNLNVQGTKL